MNAALPSNHVSPPGIGLIEEFLDSGVAVVILVAGGIRRGAWIEAVRAFPVVGNAVVVGICRNGGRMHFGPAADISLRVNNSARTRPHLVDDSPVDLISVRLGGSCLLEDLLVGRRHGIGRDGG